MSNDEIKLVADFAEQFAKLGLRHFRAHEFLFRGGSNSPGARCAGKNTLPPRKYWKNIFAVARVVDEIRHRANAPVTTLSIYRSPEYNSCIGGASASQHMQGTACDHRSSVGAKVLYDIALELRKEGFFSGGIGYYPSSNFVHVDVRGTNATWKG